MSLLFATQAFAAVLCRWPVVRSNQTEPEVVQSVHSPSSIIGLEAEVRLYVFALSGENLRAIC